MPKRVRVSMCAPRQHLAMLRGIRSYRSATLNPAGWDSGSGQAGATKAKYLAPARPRSQPAPRLP